MIAPPEPASRSSSPGCRTCALGLVDVVADRLVHGLELGPVAVVTVPDAEHALDERVGPGPVEVEEADRLRRAAGRRRGPGRLNGTPLSSRSRARKRRQLAGHDVLAVVRVAVSTTSGRYVDRGPCRRRRRTARVEFFISARSGHGSSGSRWAYCSARSSELVERIRRRCCRGGRSPASGGRPVGPQPAPAAERDLDRRVSVASSDCCSIDSRSTCGHSLPGDGDRHLGSRRARRRMPTWLPRLAQRGEVEAEPGRDAPRRGPRGRRPAGRGRPIGRGGPRARSGVGRQRLDERGRHEPGQVGRPSARAARRRGSTTSSDLPDPLAAELLAAEAQQRGHHRQLREREQPADLERRRVDEVLAARPAPRGAAGRRRARAAAGRRPAVVAQGRVRHEGPAVPRRRAVAAARAVREVDVPGLDAPRSAGRGGFGWRRLRVGRRDRSARRRACRAARSRGPA